MTDSGQEPEEGPGGRPGREQPGEEFGAGFDEEGASLPVLLEAVLSVGSDLELHATLQHIVDSATELCSARYGALGVVDPERARLTELFTAGLTEAERAAIPRLPDGRSGLLGVLISDPRPLVLDDLAQDPRAAGFPPGHPPMHSFLGVPIRVHTEIFGNLYLTEKRGGGPFTDEDLALLRVLASQAGIAIGNARLYETARRRERWIDGVAASTHGDPGDLVGTAIAPGSPVLTKLLGGEPVFIEDSATDPRMTTHVRERFGPSMMLPLQSGGQLIGTLALPRARGGPPYDAVDRLLASQFASQAALALVLADAQHDREQLAVYEDRDRIARDLHDLVVQRLFATEMMLESTRRRAANAPSGDTVGDALGHAVDELDSTIQEVRTAIFALQQPPTEAPTTFRGRVLRETGGAAVLLGFQPSVHFAGAVDALLPDPVAADLLAALRTALATAHRRSGVTSIEVVVDATASRVRLTVADDGRTESGTPGAPVTWESAL
ncbi:GAF domain-containing protein [Streptomyces sp. MB09-01]|uniref:GAF domain-containing sensor histidine kinase n=1 Tax=Streptomyces sp. MB09-01 TaxID=3028666 RepID=UPI0029A46D42|nr:GAF domain-containing protein [Streptomyces sp. MB09-01]MDX3533666.1 GAF domain-containing protein [Streptomyces sp. MB09-01]